jgi:hypothetical protein
MSNRNPVKLVGGPLDGEFWNIDHYMPVGDFAKFSVYPKTVGANFNLNEPVKPIEFKIQLYRVCVIKGSSGQQLKFLAHHTLSTWEAIELQFRK